MSDWRPFVNGGIASVTAEIVTFPVDTCKIRLQIQGQTIDVRNNAKIYSGFRNVFVKVIQEEGPRALYSGLRPALLRQATYGTLKLGLYNWLKHKYYEDESQERLMPNITIGAFAGALSAFIANPTDVLKIRMQARGGMFSNPGFWESLLDVRRQEGVKGLWRGTGPNATRAALVVGVEFAAYDYLNKRLGQVFVNPDYGHLLSGFVAGVAGAVVTNPVDVIKTRMMNQRKLAMAGGLDTAPAIYTSSFHCVTQTFKTEGPLAFYKGFIPNWSRLGPFAIVFFYTNEKLKTVDFWRSRSHGQWGPLTPDEVMVRE